MQILAHQMAPFSIARSRLMLTAIRNLQRSIRQDADNEKILTIEPKEKKAAAEIPVPIVNAVASYEEDYRPNFKRAQAYIRRGNPVDPAVAVDYDLDSEDEMWLKDLNKTEVVMDDSKLEMMINKLEFACASATNKILGTGGGTATERLSNSVLASTCHLERDVAFDVLRSATGSKHAILSAVYKYWQQKRAKFNKPLLRRLQAPTNTNDPSPFSVFRPREKANRPQTRRRRENDAANFEKMRDLRINMEMARELLEWILKRERRKRDVTLCQCDLQRLRIKLHHDPKNLHEHVDSEALASAKSRVRKFVEPESKLKDNDLLNTLFPIKPVLEALRGDDKARKKKRRDERKPATVEIPTLPPPPATPEVEMLFTKKFALTDIPGMAIPPSIDKDTYRARIGRGGRVILELKPEEDEAQDGVDGEALVYNNEERSSLNGLYVESVM